jgi:hypothetical protein
LVKVFFEVLRKDLVEILVKSSTKDAPKRFSYEDLSRRLFFSDLVKFSRCPAMGSWAVDTLLLLATK